jgi:hypothetical protein
MLGGCVPCSDGEWFMLVSGDSYCSVIDVDVSVIRGEGGLEELRVEGASVDEGEEHL